MMRGRQNVFVYGTLLRGEANHHWLRGARLLGEWRTPPCFTLYDLGPYPALCERGNQRVRGEVYETDPRGMKALDELEGYPAHYDRRRIRTPWGLAWIYFMHYPPERAVPVPSGDWRLRPAARRRLQNC